MATIQRLLNTHSDTAAFAKTKSAQEADPAVHTELHKHQTPTSPSLLPCLRFLCCSASLTVCRMLLLGTGYPQDGFLLWLITAPAGLRHIWCPTAPCPCRSPPTHIALPWCRSLPLSTPSTRGRVSEHSDHVAQDQFSQSPQVYGDLYPQDSFILSEWLRNCFCHLLPFNLAFFEGKC